jgi:hypothetical protein
MGGGQGAAEARDGLRLGRGVVAATAVPPALLTTSAPQPGLAGAQHKA